MPFSHCWMHVQGMTAVYDQEKNTVVIVKPFAANRPYNEQNIQIPFCKIQRNT